MEPCVCSVLQSVPFDDGTDGDDGGGCCFCDGGGGGGGVGVVTSVILSTRLSFGSGDSIACESIRSTGLMSANFSVLKQCDALDDGTSRRSCLWTGPDCV